MQYAAVMGLTKDLALKGNEFSNVATFLFVGLVCFEIPNGNWNISHIVLRTCR